MAQKKKKSTKEYVAIVGEIEEVKRVQSFEELQPLIDVEEFEETGELDDGTPCVTDGYGNKSLIVLEVKDGRTVPVKLDLERKFHLIREG